MNIEETKSRVKAHIIRNKERYIGGALIIGTNLIWYLATRNSGNTVSTDISIDGDYATVVNIGVQNVSDPKRLSYIITDGERWWESQSEAAKALDERPSNISNHLNHGQVLKSGAVLERVGVRSQS